MEKYQGMHLGMEVQICRCEFKNESISASGKPIGAGHLPLYV